MNEQQKKKEQKSLITLEKFLTNYSSSNDQIEIRNGNNQFYLQSNRSVNISEINKENEKLSQNFRNFDAKQYEQNLKLLREKQEKKNTNSSIISTENVIKLLQRNSSNDVERGILDESHKMNKEVNDLLQSVTNNDYKENFLKQYEEKKMEIEEQLKTLNGKKENNEDELIFLNLQKEQLSNQLKLLNEIKNLIDLNLENKNIQMSKKAEEIIRLKKVSKLLEENKSLRNDLKNNINNEELKKKIAINETMLLLTNELHTSILDLQLTQDEINVMFGNINSSIQSLQERVDILVDVELEEDKNLKLELENSEKQIKDLEKEIEDKNKEITNIEKIIDDIKKNDKTIENDLKELSNVQQNIKTKEQELEIQKQKIMTIEQEINNINSNDKETFENTFKSLSEVSDINSAIEQLISSDDKSFKELGETFKSIYSNNESLKNKKISLEKDLIDTKKQYEDLENERKKLLDEFQKQLSLTKNPDIWNKLKTTYPSLNKFLDIIEKSDTKNLLQALNDKKKQHNEELEKLKEQKSKIDEKIKSIQKFKDKYKQIKIFKDIYQYLDIDNKKSKDDILNELKKKIKDNITKNVQSKYKIKFSEMLNNYLEGTYTDISDIDEEYKKSIVENIINPFKDRIKKLLPEDQFQKITKFVDFIAKTKQFLEEKKKEITESESKVKLEKEKLDISLKRKINDLEKEIEKEQKKSQDLLKILKLKQNEKGQFVRTETSIKSLKHLKKIFKELKNNLSEKKMESKYSQDHEAQSSLYVPAGTITFDAKLNLTMVHLTEFLKELWLNEKNVKGYIKLDSSEEEKKFKLRLLMLSNLYQMFSGREHDIDREKKLEDFLKKLQRYGNNEVENFIEEWITKNEVSLEKSNRANLKGDQLYLQLLGIKDIKNKKGTKRRRSKETDEQKKERVFSQIISHFDDEYRKS